jgi:antitoxin component YwqK of YwqJK toxin-antitoxin module
MSTSDEIKEISPEFKMPVDSITVTSYWNSSQILDIHNLVDGLKHGEESWYWPDGSLMARLYWNKGVKIGIHKRYMKKGEVISEEEWDNGKLLFKKEYPVTDISQK